MKKTKKNINFLFSLFFINEFKIKIKFPDNYLSLYIYINYFKNVFDINE